MNECTNRAYNYVSMWMIKLAIFAHFSLLGLVVGQETCNSGLVGFTALTPDKLREEIRSSIQQTLSKSLETFTNRETENQVFCSSVLSLIRQLVENVNQSLTVSQEGLIQELEVSLKSYINHVLVGAVSNLTATFQEMISTLNTISPSILGSSPSNPAKSCQDILDNLTAPSGYYWLNGRDGGPVIVYCDMNRTCGNFTGGWMRVAYIDMRNSSHQCPGNFSELTREEAPSRLCTADSNGTGCFSHVFPVVGPRYNKVCGKIIGYQDKTPNAYFPFHINSSHTINDVYVDGISLTHGNPRFHIWTFAAALDETLGHLSGCFCSNVMMARSATIPSFVESNYFCDTGSKEDVGFKFYPENPLWDGEGCGPKNTCCQFNNPPWFFRELPSFIADDIEMRVCRDAGPNNEDIPFEVVELYVR